MKKDRKSFAYIDSANLYKGCIAEGFRVDYKKLRIYLEERHGVKTAYMFIGFVGGNEEMYKNFQEWGYTLIFKPTIPGENGVIKGNCDAELVLQSVSDFYEQKYEQSVIVSSDGDFACLIKFLLKRDALDCILSPRAEEKCSSLLKTVGAKLTFLPQVRDKISLQK
ncbi:MAG: Uncharacterized protein FD123_393 [Bacteroidetes bacterium]|nr:MAG: Uncharacterized protein FD123_393 [Bacteroidota bacterium]